MAAIPSAGPLNVGFLTILHEARGYLGGYLVTNAWGRPLEFRLSTAVQPNRVQQILYGGTLQPYICAELIGKTLVEKTATPAHVLFTDKEPVLEMRLHHAVPVAWLAQPGEKLCPILANAGAEVQPAREGRGAILCHPRFIEDRQVIGEALDRLDGLDLLEPFTRIREAVGEARKMGVTARA